MEIFEYLILIMAAFFAGVLNAIAGGGSFLTFPALVFVGVPPVAANATSAIAVFPGYFSSALGFFDEIKNFDRQKLIALIVLSVIGGIAGGVLLLVTPGAVFDGLVPALLLFATLLFIFDKKIARWVENKHQETERISVLPTLSVMIYGGYFNGGLGIILLALFSALGFKDLNLMNGLKNGLSFILSAASVVTFSVAGIVHWHEAIVMMIVTVIGGYMGAKLAKKLSRSIIRSVIISVGLCMTVMFLLR